MARTTRIISISTDPKELRTIDKAAARANLSRSEFYNRAAARAVADSAAPSRETSRQETSMADSKSPHNVFGAANRHRENAALDDERQAAAVAASGDRGVERMPGGHPGWRTKTDKRSE
jgi:hypothetical protein